MKPKAPQSNIYSSSARWVKQRDKWVDANKLDVKKIGNSQSLPESMNFVVCAKQYHSPVVRRYAGFGDIATGARAAERLKRNYPNAKVTLIAAHSLDESSPEGKSEAARMKNIIDIKGIESHIINEANPDQSELDKVDELLEEANFIYHAPSDIINPIAKNAQKLKDKTIFTGEYDKNVEDSSSELGIESFSTGFSERLVWYNNVEKVEEFDNPDLKKLFEENLGRRAYFSYGHDQSQTLSTVKLIKNIEPQGRPILVLSAGNDLVGELEKKESGIKINVISVEGDEIIKKTSTSTDTDRECEIDVFFTSNLSNTDFKNLQRNSSVNITSGDISTSDVVSLDKIPFINLLAKRDIAVQFLKKYQKFISDNPKYEKFKNVLNLVNDVAYNNKTVDLTMLADPEWNQFEREFTTWLKQDNQIDIFLDKAIKSHFKS